MTRKQNKMLQLNIYIFLLLCCTTFTKCLTIKEESETNAPPQESSGYRLSVAKTQEPNNRVPPHLQRVRGHGFHYEDADDVIHVIEPPKHFQELKILMQNRANPFAAPTIVQQPSKVRVVKPKISHTAKKNLKPVRPNKRPLDEDLEVEASEHLPVEILASVRKTENYLKRFKPKIPLAKQRVKTNKIQTVIWEKAHEQQQFHQGQDKKVNGIRDINNNQNRRKFLKKRIKRQTSYYQPRKGEDLLEHINDLIKNASKYLDALQSYTDAEGQISPKFETTTLKGEIITKATEHSMSAINQISEDDIIQILENSVNATDAIMEQLKIKSNVTNRLRSCASARVSKRNEIQNLREKISCMENLIKSMNDTTTAQKQNSLNMEGKPQQKPEMRNSTKRYGERLVESRKSKDLRHKPFLVASIADDYFEDSSPSPLNTSLIYDDVMTTIRNLLQARNLQNLDDSTSATSTSSTSTELSDESFTPWEDTKLPQDNAQEPIDFHNLQQYLNSLQTIVANLPQPSNATLNIQEVEGKTSKYYFINPLGGIYNIPQPFQRQDHLISPPSSIFRQFPDIPAISEYLANGSLKTSSQNTIEIL